MSIQFNKNLSAIREEIDGEEAAGLLEWSQVRPPVNADLYVSNHPHTANFHVLIAAKAGVSSWPTHAGLCAWLKPAFKSGN
jgi:hypothetical protein